MGKNFAGYDDSRPNAAKPAPGKTDCTSMGKRRGYRKDGNVTPNATKNSVSKGWKGQGDARPDSKGSRKY
jgi:hypothetical protein